MRTFKDTTGRVILGTQYPFEMASLLAHAERQISIMLFYVSYDEAREQSKVNELADLVVAARKRAVNVTVVLDRDREGDVYYSRVINAQAFKFFEANGVSVHFDTLTEATHSKIVVVDDDVVIGSHNWTLSSFYKYDDVSIRIASAELAQYYSDYIAMRAG